jgi:hypothetical protein
MGRFNASKARAAFSDLRSDDATLADIFKFAFTDDKQAELNQVIKEIALQSSFPFGQVNSRVKELLTDAGIELIQFKDGTVKLSSCAAGVADEQRAELIFSTLSEYLPTSKVNIVQNYDGSIANGPDSISSLFDEPLGLDLDDIDFFDGFSDPDSPSNNAGIPNKKYHFGYDSDGSDLDSSSRYC